MCLCIRRCACASAQPADTTTIADYHWDYDAFSRIAFASYVFSDGADGSTSFSYDATGQLIEADHTAQADEPLALFQAMRLERGEPGPE